MELSPQVEEYTISVDDRRVYYTARGPEDAEYVYLGLCGLMGGADSFWPVIQGVPDSWRVVLPDLPGCGRSETMPRPHKHDIAGYSDWLERFIEAAGLAGKKLVLASVTTGVPIAVHFAWDKGHGQQTPDVDGPAQSGEQGPHVVAEVQHLPFYGKVGIASKPLRPVVAYALLTPPLRKLVDRLRSSDALMHRIILHEPPDAIPELAERDIEHKQGADLVAAGELLHDLMLSDARAIMPYLDHPILILASEHDFSAPVPMLEDLVQGHPERKLYVYRGGQHSWNEAFIDAMNAEIGAFLKDVARAD
jgi:pimeloyl-ACP methyl ester carboxylesterase